MTTKQSEERVQLTSLGMEHVQDQLRILRAQLAALTAQKSDIGQAEKDVKARIAAIVGDLRGTIDLGGGDGLKLSYRKQFNPERATELLGSTELYASICKTEPDADLAKQVLPPAVYEMCQTESANLSIAPAVIR